MPERSNNVAVVSHSQPTVSPITIPTASLEGETNKESAVEAEPVARPSGVQAQRNLDTTTETQHHTVATESFFLTLRSDLSLPLGKSTKQTEKAMVEPSPVALPPVTVTLGGMPVMDKAQSVALAQENSCAVSKDQQFKGSGHVQSLQYNSKSVEHSANTDLEPDAEVGIILHDQQPLAKFFTNLSSLPPSPRQDQSGVLTSPSVISVPLQVQPVSSPHMMDVSGQVLAIQQKGVIETSSHTAKDLSKTMVVHSALNPLAPVYLSPTPSEAYRKQHLPYSEHLIEEDPEFSFAQGFNDSDYYHDSYESSHFDENDENEEGCFDLTDGSEDTIRQKHKKGQKLKAKAISNLASKEDLEEQSHIFGERMKK